MGGLQPVTGGSAVIVDRGEILAQRREGAAPGVSVADGVAGEFRLGAGRPLRDLGHAAIGQPRLHNRPLLVEG
jgi:hypothetical protein